MKLSKTLTDAETKYPKNYHVVIPQIVASFESLDEAKEYWLNSIHDDELPIEFMPHITDTNPEN